MKNKKPRGNKGPPSPPPIKNDFFEQLWDESWTYIKTVIDVVHEPVLILNMELCVMTANDSFYRTFQVDPKETQGRFIYELGDGQWNIPALRTLLEKILPNNAFFNGFEVNHVFPAIGHRIMLVNARQIPHHVTSNPERFPTIIILAIDDITEIMGVAESLAGRLHEFTAHYTERTDKLEIQISRLEKEIRKK